MSDCSYIHLITSRGGTQASDMHDGSTRVPARGSSRRFHEVLRITVFPTLWNSVEGTA